MEPLYFQTATTLKAAIKQKSISCRELLQIFLDRIEACNPALNAIVSLYPEQAFETAEHLDRKIRRGEAVGCLAGLPIAIKDLHHVNGMRTTYGSILYREQIAKDDDLHVARLRKADALLIGKTNTPEFGAGSQTYNELFGATRNPYDETRTSGGSSGGAAAAIASGMLPLADGSDNGGSLRNPASFCNIVGFRSSPGIVPIWPNSSPWDPLPIVGPMAKTVADIRLMLQVIMGSDSRVPISMIGDGEFNSITSKKSNHHRRIAWSSRLIELPVENEVLAVMERGKAVLQDMGFEIIEIDPYLDGAKEAYEILRRLARVVVLQNLTQQQVSNLKTDIQIEYAAGLELSASEIAWAKVRQHETFLSFSAFMTEYDALVAPVSQVMPFSINEKYPRIINGVKMENYLDWMQSCYLLTLTSHPSISMPCGFSETGLPVGLQFIGKYRQDRSLLDLAQNFEEHNPCWKNHPQ